VQICAIIASPWCSASRRDSRARTPTRRSTARNRPHLRCLRYSWFQGRFTDVRAPNEALIGHKWRRRNGRVATCHAGNTEERRLERRKPPQSRTRHQLLTSSGQLPNFARCMFWQPCHSFCDGGHGIVLSARRLAAHDQGGGKRRAGIVADQFQYRQFTVRHLCSDAGANPVMSIPNPPPDAGQWRGRDARCLFCVTISRTISVLVAATAAVLRTAIIRRAVVAPLFETVIAIVPIALR
jgi:hypothetical protein